LEELVAGLLRPRLFPFGKLSKAKSAAHCLLLFSVKLFYSFLTDSKSALGLRFFNIYIELEIFCGVILALFAEFKAKKLFIIIEQNKLLIPFPVLHPKIRWSDSYVQTAERGQQRPYTGQNQDCGSGSKLDPDSIRPVDPGGQK
jgi:hypothetical protein